MPVTPGSPCALVDSVAAEIEARLIDRYSAELSEADAVLISDYNKGVVTSSVHQVVTAARSAGKPVTANPKPSSAHWLAGASVVQLNQIEAEGAASKHGISDSNTKLGDFPNEIGQVLREKLDVRTLLVTRGGKGLMLYRQDVPPLHVPPIPVEVYDVAGAGDTVISTLTLGIAAGGSIEDSAFVANHAAACVVRKVGVATVTVAEILGDQ
ncbi:MAG: PfkB family carbohydrate kinase [Chthonomonadales bacterium]